MTVDSQRQGFLAGLRVLEIADERGEFCGSLLVGAGADVIKIEPPEGSPTRRIGPFVDDVEDVEQSLFFWRYCAGKRSITLDLGSADGRRDMLRLVATADIVLESLPPGELDGLGLGYSDLLKINPELIMASISPFGQSGPYRDWLGADLVHLAMGGVMMNAGYDPTPEGDYDTPPIAPQMWHSNHMVGAQTADAIVAALLYRARTGNGQYIDASIHQAVSATTGSDIATWMYSRQTPRRQTGRYSSPRPTPESLATTKDGRHVLAFVSAEFMIGREHPKWVELLERHNSADDLTDPKFQDLEYVTKPEVIRHVHAVARHWVGGYKYDRAVWLEAQGLRLHWAPVRRPEDNLSDPHWAERATFAHVHHEEIGRTVRYPSAPWLSETCPWQAGTRAPRLGEHTAEILDALTPAPSGTSVANDAQQPSSQRRAKSEGAINSTPSSADFALDGIRILDMSWVVAGAGATRILAGMGAEVIRLEWEGRHDVLRTLGGIPVGEERERVLRGESVRVTRAGVNQGSGFSEMNPGKRSFSLNLKSERGMELFHDLVRASDVVFENYTANRLESFGATYESMRRVNPSIIYAQQSGFGKRGRYSENLSSAPVAEAFSGLTDMAGMPSPYPPSGWGHYYVDSSTSYYGALAILLALYHRERTGEGQYIDGSLGEPALLLTGTAMLDFQINGRSWERTGNASPYKPASPHGAFPCEGHDRWIAIAVFDDRQWRALVSVLDEPAWARSPELATSSGRLENANTIETSLAAETASWDAYLLMERLQAAGVPAGVCQTAEDRLERDPQLRADDFVVPLDNSEVGTWPVRQFPIKMAASPVRAGGRLGRGYPCYAEDNDYVYRDILGLSDSDIAGLEEQGVI